MIMIIHDDDDDDDDDDDELHPSSITKLSFWFRIRTMIHRLETDVEVEDVISWMRPGELTGQSIPFPENQRFIRPGGRMVFPQILLKPLFGETGGMLRGG